MPKLIYHNKWFQENVSSIQLILPHEERLPIPLQIEWRICNIKSHSFRGSALQSGHAPCLILILGHAGDIRGMQLGDTSKPFFVVVNGLGRKKIVWALKLQKLPVTWLMSNVESYIILVSVSCYEVQKCSYMWTLQSQKMLLRPKAGQCCWGGGEHVFHRFFQNQSTL